MFNIDILRHPHAHKIYYYPKKNVPVFHIYEINLPKTNLTSASYLLHANMFLDF